MDAGRETCRNGDVFPRRVGQHRKTLEAEKAIIKFEVIFCFFLPSVLSPSLPGVQLNSSKCNWLVSMVFGGRKKKRVACSTHWSDEEEKGTVRVRRSNSGEGKADRPCWDKYLLTLLMWYCSEYGSLLGQRMGHRIFYICLTDFYCPFTEQFLRW